VPGFGCILSPGVVGVGLDKANSDMSARAGLC